MPASGETGFEGLLRDAVAKVIGRRLNLVKSGAQKGADAGTDAQDGAPFVVVEAKRYGEKTPLALDELKGKLVEAIHSRPELDVYIFGATREISRDDQDELVAVGGHEGVGVAFVDWPDSATILPPVAVLCALVPEAVLYRLDAATQAQIQADLDAILADVRFQQDSKTLVDRLTRPDMGYLAASRTVATWLRGALGSRNAAVARFGNLVNLLDPDIRRVERPRLVVALDGWWRLPSVPLALLGDEGVGKSWVPLAWWHERAGAEGIDLPLTLVISATDVADIDVEGLVARLLAKRTGVRDEAFWKRRLKLWLEVPSEKPRIVLIFDGLNENWTFQGWARLLACLHDEPWSGKAAVVLTCRPDHWNTALSGVKALKPPPLLQNMGPFDDGELKALLAMHGLTPDDFVAALLPLLKVPRYCELAIRHRQAVAESGDITLERLIYEDWKDRLHRRGSDIPIGDTEFHQFIAGLGKRLRERVADGEPFELSVTRQGLTAELGSDSGYGPEKLAGAISEIVDGRWMELVNGNRHRFVLNKSLTTYALGMALVDHLRQMTDQGLSDRLAEFIEPLREQDLLVGLMRAAVTVALADDTCSRNLRRLLIDKWFRRQNFQQVDFETFWRLLPQDVEAFFSVAEETWLHRQVGVHDDEVLIKSFSNAAERWPAAGRRIADWCAKWLGTYWADPREGMVIGYDPKADGVEQRRIETLGRRQSWDAIADQISPAVPVRAGIDGRVSWLACRILGVLSYTPRSTFVPALTAWAVSRAIMGPGVEYDQVAWILRLPRAEDDSAYLDAIVCEARRLLALNHPVATEAARKLLAALGTPEAARMAESLPHEVHGGWSWPTTVTADEASGRLTWDYDKALGKPRSAEAPLSAACDLNKYAVNPRWYLSNDDADKLAALANETDVTRLWLIGGNSSERIALEDAEAALARWAPTSLGALYRRLFAEAPKRAGEALNQIAWNFPAHLFLLSKNEIAAVATAEQHEPTDKKRYGWAILTLTLAALVEKSSSEQIAFYAGQPEGPNFDSKHEQILTPPTAEDFVEIARYLDPNASMEWLRGWLWYLKHSDLRAMPPGYPALVPLLTHPALEVRRATLEVVCRSSDEVLAEVLFDSQWQCTQDMDRKEAIFGSLALTEAAKSRPAAEIRRRIDPLAWGFLARRDNISDESLDAFAGQVQQWIYDDLCGNRASSSYGQDGFNLEVPCELLTERRGDQVVAWLQPLISGERKPRFGMFTDSFPYIDLCRGLLRYRPEEGAKLWTRMRDHYDRGIVRRADFTLLPFEAPDSDPVRHLRDNACQRAKTDEELGNIATAVIRHDRQEWLIDYIRGELAGAATQSAGRTARGLWLAGMLDFSDAADALWRDERDAPPGPGWLTEVYNQARYEYRRNKWAHHWLDAFLSERDRDRAFGFHRLFVKSADHRAFGWAPKRVGDVLSTLPRPWLTHWSLSWEELKKAAEERDKKWKDQLFGDKISSHVHWPWR